jgi:hypothetical protein
MDPGTIAQLVTLATVIVGFFYQAYRETRQRRWDLEDRIALAATVMRTATDVQTTVHQTAATLQDRVTETAATLQTRVSETAATLQEQVVAQASGVAQRVTDVAAAMDTKVDLQVAALHKAVAENTDISTKAFQEANHVNLKLEKLGLEHNQLQAARQQHQRRTDERPGDPA